MSITFFGQFLMERDKITAAQLLEAAEYQRAKNPKLGALALELGMLNASQVEAIHLEQQRTDKLFGEIGMEMGCLSPEQIEELLKQQKQRRILFGQALVQLGYLKPDVLMSELVAFKAQQEAGMGMLDDLLSNVPEPVLMGEILDITVKVFRRFADEAVKIQTCHRDVKRWNRLDYLSYVSLVGDMKAILALAFSQEYASRIASKLMRREMDPADPMVLDILGEFLNVLGGNVCTKLSLRDLNLDLSPPTMVPSDQPLPFTPNGNSAIFPMASLSGQVELAIFRFS